MRVCVVAENHPLALMGGAEYQTGLLTEELCARPGVQVTYLARRVPGPKDAALLPYAVQCIGSDAGIRRRAAFFDALNLQRALTQLRPDVIYQQAKQSYTAVCARYAMRSGVPFFFHVASDADLGHRWISLHLSFNTPFDIAESLSGDWGIRHASHIIVQTDRQAQTLQSKTGRVAAAVVRNFQPLPSSLPTKPAGPLQILWVANLKDVKRPELFVDLAESFSDRDDLHFVMVGRPTALRRFAALMQRIPKIANLTYLGEQPIDRVNELMATAAFHVNTSSFEGFPNTFIQAWARGAVVMSIAVDPDGMAARGIGYCAGSPYGLHSRLDELSRSTATRQAIAERAFAHAQSHHSLAARAHLADLMLAAASGHPSR
ncbi:MAG TPA: glycosyltransferase family 4 protein [Steroidobacteraceae bacterium]